MKQKIMSSTILTNETGRSMVEMLGVLAIIGVLSVGGISAYGVAMKKHKANELLHRASMLASTVSAQIMSGKDPTTLDTFADSNLGKFTLDYDSTKTTFDLKIFELDGSVCSQLKKGGMVQKVECNETASITYYKNLATDPAEGAKSPTGGSGAGGESGEKLWEPTLCEDSTDCLGECEICNGWGECVKSQSDTCSCSADEMEVDYDGDGVIDCIPCTYSWGMSDISADGCAKCPNREMDENDEYCVLKECPSGYLKDPYSDCYPCDSLDDIWDISAEECAKCPNRKMNEDGYYCVLSECPDGYVFDLSRERCESCYDRDPYLVETPDECAKCPNREIDPAYEDENICTIKCPDNYFKETHGQECLSCDVIYVVNSTNATECARCPNRMMVGDTKCALKECPDGHIKSDDHYCWPCDMTDAIWSDPVECAKCGNRKMFTTRSGSDVCVLKECPDGKILDDWGECYKPR